MNNKSLRSILTFMALLPILMMAMLTPTQADHYDRYIKIDIKPHNTIANSTDDAYIATMYPENAPPGGFFFLNVTIPKGYELILPAKGNIIGTYTMFNKTTWPKRAQVIIKIISNDSIAKTVDVNYSTDYGFTYSMSRNQPIDNMVIGATTLKLTEPSASSPGYLNISLGGAAGPILKKNEVTVKMSKGTLRNPNPAKTTKYTWYIEAKNPISEPYTGHDDVIIVKGRSKHKWFNFNVKNPVEENSESGNLGVRIATTSTEDKNDHDLTLKEFDGDPIPEEKKGAEGLSRIMFLGVDAPELQDSPFTGTIRVNYGSELPLPVPEENLRLYRFNDSTSTWEKTTDSRVDTKDNIVYGTVTGFSTFAVMGAPASSGGGGGGTGGGGVTTSEPFDNIAKAERDDRALIANTPVTYIFKAPEHGIYEIAVTGKENENDISIRVEALKGTSKLVTASSPGIVYKNVNVWAGTKRITEALLRFKIENSWLNENNLAGSDAKLLKWDGSKWIQLETIEKTNDDTYSYYEAKSDTFSVFAITVLKDSSAPKPSATGKETIQTTPTDKTATNPVEKIAGFEIVIALIALSAVFKLKRR